MSDRRPVHDDSWDWIDNDSRDTANILLAALVVALVVSLLIVFWPQS